MICLCSICSSNSLCRFAEIDESVDLVYYADQVGYVFAAHSAPRVHFLIALIDGVDCVDHVACMLVYIHMLLATVKDATVRM